MEESKTFAEIAPNLMYLVYALGLGLIAYLSIWKIKKTRPQIQISQLGKYLLIFIFTNFVLWIGWYWVIDSEPLGIETLISAGVSFVITLTIAFIEYIKNKGNASPT